MYRVSCKIWYSGSVCYRPGKIFIIDHGKIQSDKNSGWKLIGDPEEPDRYLLDHEYFCIHDDLFDRIQ